MFEGSLVESRGLAGTGTERWTALGSVTVQCAVAGLLMAIPLLRPEILQVRPGAPPLAVPFLRRPPVPVEMKATATSTAAMSMPAAGPIAAASGRTIWPHPGLFADGPAPMIDGNLGMGPGGAGTPGGIGLDSVAQPSVVVVKPKDVGPVRVSQGVSQGMLMTAIQPVYPPIARASRTQGTVVIEAVISKAGRIESLHTVSGPAMLSKAAMDAVAAARYRPFLLNGEPTEVQTTITVVFSLTS